MKRSLKHLLLFVAVLIFGLCLFPSSAAADHSWGGEQGLVGAGSDGVYVTPDEDPWDVNRLPEDVDAYADWGRADDPLGVDDGAWNDVDWLKIILLYPQPF